MRLEGEEAHHCARVLRVRAGEEISVGDGTGRVVRAVVTGTGEGRVVGRVVDRWDRPLPTPEMVLYQGVARREKFDQCVQRAVEVGVRRIVPLVCERSVVRWDEGKRERYRSRWTEIARAAAKQSRSPWLATIEPFAAGVRELPRGGHRLVLDAGAETPFRKALPEARPASLGIVVGPEGGFTPAELDLLETAGGVPATLGERILRTETAGPVGIALAAYAYGLLG